MKIIINCFHLIFSLLEFTCNSQCNNTPIERSEVLEMDVVVVYQHCTEAEAEKMDCISKIAWFSLRNKK